MRKSRRPRRQPGFTPWWEFHAQKDWTEDEWREWEEEGRPRVPLDMRLPDRRPTTSKLPVSPADRLLPAGFSLRPLTLSEKADRVLKAYGVR